MNGYEKLPSFDGRKGGRLKYAERFRRRKGPPRSVAARRIREGTCLPAQAAPGRNVGGYAEGGKYELR